MCTTYRNGVAAGGTYKTVTGVDPSRPAEEDTIVGVGEGLKCWAGSGRVGEGTGGGVLIPREEMLTPEHWVVTWR